MKKATIGLTVCLILILSGSVNAFTLSNIKGGWGNLRGEAGFEDYVDFYRNDSEVLWGRGLDYHNRRSGLRFMGASSQIFEEDIVFNMGTLIHFNRKIATGTEVSAADLEVTLEFANDPATTFSFDIAFQIEETPNTIPGLSDDHITFEYEPINNRIFAIDEKTYTFSVLGFMNSDGDYINQFDSAESQSNRAYLYGQISSYDGGQQAAVPEPATYLLLASGLIALTAFKKRRYI